MTYPHISSLLQKLLLRHCCSWHEKLFNTLPTVPQPIRSYSSALSRQFTPRNKDSLSFFEDSLVLTPSFPSFFVNYSTILLLSLNNHLCPFLVVCVIIEYTLARPLLLTRIYFATAHCYAVCYICKDLHTSRSLESINSRRHPHH